MSVTFSFFQLVAGSSRIPLRFPLFGELALPPGVQYRSPQNFPLLLWMKNFCMGRIKEKVVKHFATLCQLSFEKLPYNLLCRFCTYPDTPQAFRRHRSDFYLARGAHALLVPGNTIGLQLKMIFINLFSQLIKVFRQCEKTPLQIH